MEYVNSKEDTQMQKIITNQHINPEMLQTAGRLKTESQRGTRQIKGQDSREEDKERWRGKKMRGQLPRNLAENWWLMKSHIVGENFCDIKWWEGGGQKVQ